MIAVLPLWSVTRPITEPQPLLQELEASPAGHCGARPVLLIDGFVDTPFALGRLAAQLCQSGYCTQGVTLGGLFSYLNVRPIEELVRVVAWRVEQLVRGHGYERIDLVAYSEGGLIGRYYVQRMNGARHVRHLITLGTPHRDALWAYPSYRPGRLSSPAVLHSLLDESFPRSVRLTSIYARRDSVCPPPSCRLQERWGPNLKNVEVPYGGHVEFLFKPEVAAIICRELEATDPRGARLQRTGLLPEEPSIPVARAA